MAKHTPHFLKLVEEAKNEIAECSVHDVKRKLDSGEPFHLIDVREESEFAGVRIPGAVHLGKGVIERDIEEMIPQTDAEIVLFCGGGYRSALAARNLQQMGYPNVFSMEGGLRDWREQGYVVEET